MLIRVDSHSPVPVYRQIIDQIIYCIASGEIASGDILPSIRVLSMELRINPNTIIRAYRELELRGFLESEHGSGFFVTSGSSKTARVECCQATLKLMQTEIKKAISIGITRNEILSIVDEAVRERKKG